MAFVSLKAQITCVRREIIRRADAAPGQIATGALTWPQAKQEQEAMTAVLQTLINLQDLADLRAARRDEAECPC